MKRNLLLLFLLSFEICSAQQWFPLEGGLSGTNSQTDKVVAMCADTVNHILYVGGKFLQANESINVYSIAKWNGISWEQLINYGDTIIAPGDTGLIQYATSTTSLVIHNSNLYSTVENGNFHSIIEINLNNLVRRGIGYLNGTVNQLYVYEDTLYACGAFTIVNNTYGGTNYPISGIAKWNGTQWQQVGGGISVGGFSEVHSLCVHHNKLYAAGIFENAGGTYCKNIACWNDTSWSAVGNGFGFSGQFDCILLSLASYKNKLFLGGTFHQSDGYISTGLAYWNDTTFKPGGVSADLIYAMKEFNGKLYIGGWEAGQGISPNDRVSCYNDTSWSATGAGPENPVYAMEVFDSSLYVGGEFLHVDSTTFVGYITRYDPTIIQDTTAIVEVKQNGSAINIYPNPATNQLTVESVGSNQYAVSRIEITNSLGVTVYTESENPKSKIINLKSFPSGIYFIKLYFGDGSMEVKKFVKE